MNRSPKSGDAIVIRNLQENDYRLLLEMYRDFHPKNYFMGLPPIIELHRVEWIKDLLHEKFNIVAVDGYRIVGHAAIIDVPTADFCELIVFVHQDYRGRGIGKKLTEEICQRAMVLGKKKIWLMVDSKNEVAIRIYYKIGFRITKMYGEVYEMELDISTPFDVLGI
ncbi:MAG: GNAT family N-acetyltransferase [Spirochaetes bacterium]|nr:GNAT family N-acetyltransferase [Spirochaetota bacterium]